MSNLQDIADVFSAFHEGVITTYEDSFEKLMLTIECSYLAERIKPEFERFHIEIINVEKIEFNVWRPENHPQEILLDLDKIFQTELEIRRATVADCNVFIHCNVNDIDCDYSGGTLCLNCNGVKIYDQDHNPLSIGFFDEIVSGYCESVRNRNNH